MPFSWPPAASYLLARHVMLATLGHGRVGVWLYRECELSKGFLLPMFLRLDVGSILRLEGSRTRPFNSERLAYRFMSFRQVLFVSLIQSESISIMSRACVSVSYLLVVRLYIIASTTAAARLALFF